MLRTLVIKKERVDDSLVRITRKKQYRSGLRSEWQDVPNSEHVILRQVPVDNRESASNAR